MLLHILSWKAWDRAVASVLLGGKRDLKLALPSSISGKWKYVLVLYWWNLRTTVKILLLFMKESSFYFPCGLQIILYIIILKTRMTFSGTTSWFLPSSILYLSSWRDNKTSGFADGVWGLSAILHGHHSLWKRMGEWEIFWGLEEICTGGILLIRVNRPDHTL